MFAQMDSDRRRIISDVVSLVYFMRGAIQYHSMMAMSRVERQAVDDFIGERLKSESKKEFPQY